MKALSALIRAHRILLVVSTVGIGVAGSQAAADTPDPPWILLLGAFAVMLWLSDVCRQLDDTSRDLVRSAKAPYSQVASDLLRGADAAKVGIGFTVVALAAAAATLWFIVSSQPA